MGVAKMKYINVYGPEKRLLPTLGTIARCECFAPESSEAILSAISAGTNQYEPLLTKAKGLLKDLGASSLAADFTGEVNTYELEEVSAFLERFAGEVSRRSSRRTNIEAELELYAKTADLLTHMVDVDVDLDDLFKVQTLKVRVGRLPKSSYVRLAYYAEKGFNFTNHFNFTVYDFDGEYYWGLYFAPVDSAKAIDDIFSSLYFERTWVPEFVHGRPEEALESIRRRQADLKKELSTMLTPADIAAEEDLVKIKDKTAWLAYMNQLYDMRKYALSFNRTFYISGFVPEECFVDFEKKIEALPGVHIKEADRKQEVPARPPVKLKNGWFARPYQMYTEMYGLPSYHDIDPTGVVAVLYSVLYGIMFADLGQGLVLGLLSYFYLHKKRNMAIGLILVRASFFSCLFGILFGSFFGNEEIIREIWHMVGLPGAPFHVMAANNVNTILIVSVAIGVVVTAIAIIMGVLTKYRRGKKGEAFTSPNGFAGLVFYLSVIAFALDMLVFKLGYSKNILFIVVALVIPLIVMFLQEPLSEVLDGQKVKLKELPGFLSSGFFELFVSLLEYLSNTVSFLRVGGFVLVHGGMMSVVATLAATVGGAAAPLVWIFGNIFVIALEGLLVGIQALRLNYYELFSRFYEADGIPFEPLVITHDTIEL